DAAYAGCVGLWHELQEHAGAGLGDRLPAGTGLDADGVSTPLSLLQMERLALKRDDFDFESSSRFSLLLEHDPKLWAGAGLFRKPIPTPDQVRGRLFRNHALATRAGRH